jgi:hypothetical protein
MVTLLLLLIVMIRIVVRGLNTQASSASGADVDGAEFAVLDT